MHLGQLITAILTHRYQPQTVLLATIASITQIQYGKYVMKRIRGITICSSYQQTNGNTCYSMT